MRVGVIIPAYNEEKTIGGLVGKVTRYVDKEVVVDDGSGDNTSEEAERAGAVVLTHKNNQGKGASLREGFQWALKENLEAVITMDADGQHNPDEIPLFLQKAEEREAGIIVGFRRMSLKNMPLVRLLTNKATSFIVSRLSGQEIPDSQCGYRLIKREVLRNVDLETSKYDTESEILLKASKKGFKVKGIPIKTIYSSIKSEINPFTDTLRFIRLIIRSLFR